MPNRHDLQPGDRIRLLCVPEADLLQRERELREGVVDDPGWTADTIERILAIDPVVTIQSVDEDGFAWFEYVFERRMENEVHHLIAIIDDDSWEYA